MAHVLLLCFADTMRRRIPEIEQPRGPGAVTGSVRESTENAAGKIGKTNVLSLLLVFVTSTILLNSLATKFLTFKKEIVYEGPLLKWTVY